ncbi:MAG TPA: hypothetical protein VFE30_14205 [Anaeromyxobacteraceae bacterium]|jgi:hypothetical protein|nr:hypothetical protein [Anaeromyxobacteraceae bacterium]
MNAKLLVPLCLLAAACGAENGSSILVAGRVQTPVWNTGGSCLFVTGTYQIGPGVFDVMGAGHYDMALEIDNNMTDPATSGTGGAAGSRTWSAYAVRTRVINGSEFNPPVVNVASQTTVPADSTAVRPGEKVATYQPVIGTLLGAQIATAVQGLAPSQSKSLQLGVTLLGKTADGNELDTAEKTFPLEVCNGCLAGIPTCVSPQVVSPAGSCYPSGEDSFMYTCK